MSPRPKLLEEQCSVPWHGENWRPVLQGWPGNDETSLDVSIPFCNSRSLDTVKGINDD